MKGRDGLETFPPFRAVPRRWNRLQAAAANHRHLSTDSATRCPLLGASDAPER